MGSIGDATNAATGRITVEKFVAYLNKQGITEEELGRVSRLNYHQGYIKNADDEIETVDLFGITLSPSWDEGPKWPVVQPAAPVKLTKAKPRSANGTRTILVLPDPQIGFLRLADGEMIPMHDDRAIGACAALAGVVKPDLIVWLGDLLDMSEWTSKFVVLPEFVQTTQPALDSTHLILARFRELAPEQKVLGGNHDDRLALSIARNSRSALRLRPAATTPDHWPVLSLPNLLRLADIDTEYVGAYPAGRVKLTQGNETQAGLVALHGERLDVVKVAKESRQSVVQGHIHRIASHSETYEMEGRPWNVQAFSPGCLCRIDGAVPSTHSGNDDYGRPVIRWENWQQGCAVVTEYDDGAWAAELVPIHAGRALWRGKAYDAA